MMRDNPTAENEKDDTDLQRIRQYITDNPMQWELDQLHPNNLSKW